jgi:hypothetical protein
METKDRCERLQSGKLQPKFTYQGLAVSSNRWTKDFHFPRFLLSFSTGEYDEHANTHAIYNV